MIVAVSTTDCKPEPICQNTATGQVDFTGWVDWRGFCSVYWKWSSNRIIFCVRVRELKFCFREGGSQHAVESPGQRINCWSHPKHSHHNHKFKSARLGLKLCVPQDGEACCGMLHHLPTLTGELRVLGTPDFVTVVESARPVPAKPSYSPVLQTAGFDFRH